MNSSLKYIISVFITALLSSVITILIVQEDETPKQKSTMVDMMNSVYEELDLNEKQVNEFNKVTMQFHQNGKRLSQKMKEINQAFYLQFTKDSLDEIKLKKLAEDYSIVKKSVKELYIDYYIKTESFLDKNQIKKLKAIYFDAVEYSKKK